MRIFAFTKNIPPVERFAEQMLFYKNVQKT